MLRTITTVALATALAWPAAAQQNQAQGDQQQNRAQQNRAQGQMQQGQDRQALSQEAQACLQQLEQVDRQLAGIGYGRAGPGGYGVAGGGYGAAAPTATGMTGDGTLGATFAGPSTPRGDMRALMRAGYVMALNGYGQGCQQVAQAAEEIGTRYREAVRTGEADTEEMRRWRSEFLASAVKVTQLDQPMRAEEIIGADLRNTRDEDLGDIEDVVFGADGQPRYVIVSTGGFLGLGEDMVPVRWQDLKVTAQPYRDTFVLEVDEQTFENAPRLSEQGIGTLARQDGGEEFDRFWQQTGLGK